MRDPWKALPWVASLSLHATAFFFLAGLLLTVPSPERKKVELDLSLSLSSGALPGRSVTPTTPGTRPAASYRTTRTAPRVTAASSRGVPQGERLSPPHPRGGNPASTELPPEPKAAWEESWSSDDTPDGTGVAVGTAGANIRWDTVSRKLIRGRDPRFPAVLSALGQEVECEARITVAPSGMVTRVEITRSSGYIEIDAGVEAALRDYLFSRADGSAETVGTKRFHFRLEKTD